MNPALEADLREVRRHFEEAEWHISAVGLIALCVRVQGVEVQCLLHPTELAERPPALMVSPRLLHALVRRGRVEGLEAQRRWNRTLGVSALLFELEARLRDDPPAWRDDPLGVAGYLLRALLGPPTRAREPR